MSVDECMINVHYYYYQYLDEDTDGNDGGRNKGRDYNLSLFMHTATFRNW